MITWDGLDEYEAALQAWPAAAAADAYRTVERRAMAAFEAIQGAYPVRTGRLKAGLQIRDVTTDAMKPSYRVWNDTVYARVWESGAMGPGGWQAPGKNFIPKAIAQRRAMREELIAIVKTGAERVTVDE